MADSPPAASGGAIDSSPRATEHELTDSPGQLWWVLAITGGLSLVAGIVVLAAPKSSLVAIAVILGIYLIVLGLNPILTAIFRPEQRGEHRSVALVTGAFAVVVGIVVITRPESSVKFVAVVFGIFLIISGVRDLILSFSYVSGRWVPIVRGALALIAGVIIVVWPKIGLATLALIVGIELILAGLVQLWAAWVARRIAHAAG